MSRIDPPRDLQESLRYRSLGALGAGLLRILGSTWSIDWLGRREIEAVRSLEGRVVYAFWHGGLLPLAYTHRGRGIVVLVSRHQDGEIISQTISRLGYGVARGSSTRGGVRALLEMARLGREGHPLAVTPDGPRGPRRHLQGGVLQIAQRSGQPIVPLAVEAVRRTELGSWDRFLIPHPGSRLAVAVGDPIRIPPEIDAAAVEKRWSGAVAAGLAAVEARVAAWRAERIGAR